jgi:hypothetical protein
MMPEIKIVFLVPETPNKAIRQRCGLEIRLRVVFIQKVPAELLPLRDITMAPIRKIGGGLRRERSFALRSTIR